MNLESLNFQGSFLLQTNDNLVIQSENCIRFFPVLSFNFRVISVK